MFSFFFFFFFNDPATTEIYTPLYTLSLHDALPIRLTAMMTAEASGCHRDRWSGRRRGRWSRSEEHTSELQSHSGISYADFCLKKKKGELRHQRQERPERGQRHDSAGARN